MCAGWRPLFWWKTSSRVYVIFTGRPMARLSMQATRHDGVASVLPPNAPPTVGMTTRIFSIWWSRVRAMVCCR